MPLAIGLLIVLCAILLFRLAMLEKDLRSGAGQLKDRRETASGAPLRLAAPNASAEALLAQVNALLRQGEDERAAFREREKVLRQQIANVSHDLRTPLTSIRGYVEAMTDGTIPPELHEKYLNIILFETERLTDLTNDLLTLNEFDTKELLLDKTRFDIQEMIKNTAASFEGVCTEKRVSIELLLLPEQTFVFADSRKIQQVLYNLIDNAIKFSENDDSVKIEVVQKGGKIFVSVKDTGIGIPKREINKIWERFYKSDASRGKDKKGTGLGLSIVKEAILAHDEHINVISTEGVGTEFIFSLARVE